MANEKKRARHDDDTIVSRGQLPNSGEPEWLQKIISSINKREGIGGNTTSSLLKSHHMKMKTESVLPLLHYIKSGDKEQQHDAAKAIGYIAKAGAMTTSQKLEMKAFLTDVLHKGDLSLGVAFAILEALERIDPDAFWQLIMGWYGMSLRKQEDKRIQDNT